MTNKPTIDRLVAISTAHAPSAHDLAHTNLLEPIKYGTLLFMLWDFEPWDPPQWLEPVIAWAKDLGVDWVLFDRDAPCVEGLPIFDW